MRTDVREQVVSAKNGGIECEGEASITEICHAGVDCPPRKSWFIDYSDKIDYQLQIISLVNAWWAFYTKHFSLL